MTTLAADMIEAHSVSMATAATMLVFVGGIVWWLGMRFQSIDDALARINPILSKVEELAVISARLKAVEEKCGKWCPALAPQTKMDESNFPRENYEMLKEQQRLLHKMTAPDKPEES